MEEKGMEEVIWQVAITASVAGLVLMEAIRLASKISAKKRAEKGSHGDKKPYRGDGEGDDL